MKCLVCSMENSTESLSCSACGEASWDLAPVYAVDEASVPAPKSKQPRQPKATKKLDQDDLLALISEPISEDGDK